MSSHSFNRFALERSVTCRRRGYGYVLTYGITALAGPITVSKGFVLVSVFIPSRINECFLNSAVNPEPPSATVNNFAKWNKVPLAKHAC